VSVSAEPKTGPPRAVNFAWFRGAGLLEPIRHKVIAFDSVYYPSLEEFIWGGGKWTRGAVPPGELRFRRRRDRKSVGNTGASAALVSHIRAFDVLPQKGCNWYPHGEDHPMAFLVNGFSNERGRFFADPGAFHWRALSVAKKVSSGSAVRGDGSGLTKAELRNKRKLISGYHDEGESPVDPWASDDEPADASSDPDKSAFDPETPRTFMRVRDRYKTDEEDFQDREALEATRKKCEAILRAGEAWSPLDPPEDTVVLEAGVKYNRSNLKFKKLMWDINVATKNYDTQKELAEDLGLRYNTVRQGEMAEINMNKEMPTTKFTKVQIEDMLEHDGRVVYVHATLDRGRWYELDVERHATYREAIEEVRWRAQEEALKKAGVPSRSSDRRTPESDPVLARVFKEVVVRFDEAFKPEHLYIADWRTPTVRAQAQIAWEEENGVPNVTPAP
jgi:hypothetical protein